MAFTLQPGAALAPALSLADLDPALIDKQEMLADLDPACVPAPASVG